MHDKTEYLFESDAEKVVLKEALKSKKKSLGKRFLNRSIVFSCFFIAVCFVLSYYEKSEIAKLSASVVGTNFKSINEEFLSNSSSLQKYDNIANKYQIIINKANKIEEKDLKKYEIVNVNDNIIPNVKLEKETYENYLKLKENLEKKGYYLNIRSGYRSFNESQIIYNNYVIEKGQSYADKYVALPGTSEHNLGIAFDAIVSSDKYATSTNYNSDAYIYLKNVAYLYGFIIRYPKNKEIITGYEYEPWHFRYVGYELAKYLNKSDLTLEEYYNLKD